MKDEAAPVFDHNHAAAFTSLNIPTFTCTPEIFPDLISAAIRRGDLKCWTPNR
ncbi:MAG: hypothetical protein ACO1QB_09645 [Verrucomicrobiales bacterium]